MSGSWIKVGHTLIGRYIGIHEVIGVVTESRVKYGGKVQHTLDLLKPLVMPFGETRTTVLIDEDNVVQDCGITEMEG